MQSRVEPAIDSIMSKETVQFINNLSSSTQPQHTHSHEAGGHTHSHDQEHGHTHEHMDDAGVCNPVMMTWH